MEILYESSSSNRGYPSQEVARQAAAACAASGDTVDDKDREYNPLSGPTAPMFCLETKQGTLIDDLDEF